MFEGDFADMCGCAPLVSMGERGSPSTRVEIVRKSQTSRKCKKYAGYVSKGICKDIFQENCI